jgi:hypothetical protein
MAAAQNSTNQENKSRKEKEHDKEKCVGCKFSDGGNDCDTAAVSGIIEGGGKY